MLEVYSGGASFYSDSFHGRKTANGERYNKNDLTAAHRFLPMGTVVRVTNLHNGKDVLLRINDRGPHKKTRILDVSRAAATHLNMVRRGVASVQVEVIADRRGVPTRRGNAFYLRVDEAKSLADAHKKLNALSSSRLVSRHAPRSTGLDIFSIKDRTGKKRYFIGQGPFPRYNDAVRASARLQRKAAAPSVVCLPLSVAQNTP